MKNLTVVLFENALENKKYFNRVCEKFTNLSTEKEFCGIWGEILFNDDECLSAISATVNHFINDTEKTEIIFGCCKKDYNAILAKIHVENCSVDTVHCQDL